MFVTQNIYCCNYKLQAHQSTFCFTPAFNACDSVVKGKGKGFPYSTPSVGVQAVSLQVTVSHPPGGRLPLLSARPAVTSSAAEHHCPLARTKLYCLVTETHMCKQLV